MYVILTWTSVISLLGMLVYIIALCSSLNTTTFSLIPFMDCYVSIPTGIELETSVFREQTAATIRKEREVLSDRSKHRVTDRQRHSL
ncbi:hypothetical protein EJ02DRAFT_98718 [Clathrospora elynae]|uniref:Uncharacterized protein n=1 Tax=Clathrospora elynae TaxID=706981 RepID=A0A6A5SX54_9PLEO|nr:hypothetical protein EJ02DRAFT_98718 [Clathrospora elynae]